MTLIKRSACIGAVLLLLCTGLLGCVSQQEQIPEEDPALIAVKAEWKSYFIDRTKEVQFICINPSQVSSFIAMIYEKETIDEVLEICKTLDIGSLQTEKSWETDQTLIGSDMLIAICTSPTDPNSDSISIIIDVEGKTTFIVTVDGKEYQAYAEGWNVYEDFQEYRWIDQTASRIEE